jgi:Undecaprenyl-phosphate galactose phosphotransferase WbaP
MTFPSDQFKNPKKSSQLKLINSFSREIMTFLIIGTDLIVIILAGWLSIQIRILMGNAFINLESYYTIIAPLLLLIILGFTIAGNYPGIGVTPVEEIKRTSYTISITIVVLSFIVFLTQKGVVYSRIIFVLFWLLILIGIPVCRFITKKLVSLLKLWGEPIAIIGYGPQGQKIYHYLLENPLYGIRPIIIVNSLYSSQIAFEGESELPEIRASVLEKDKMILARSGIRSAIVIPSEIPAVLRRSLVDEHQFGLHKLILISSLNWVGGSAVIPHNIGGLLGLEIEHNLLKASEQILKRILDLFLMIIGCLVGFPILFICMGLIRLDSRGPILFTQERIGKDGKKFLLWKYRTMLPNSDEVLEKYLSGNEDLRKEWEANHKLKNDPRVTRVGKFLRKTSLDELPQLINVLMGEMSLVGPRPIVSDEIKYYKESYRLYTQVLPGMTGLWQISGRSNVSYENRVSLDEYYIRHWSIWMDIYILVQTIWVVIKGAGAY